jgi:hypothetical protein
MEEQIDIPQEYNVTLMSLGETRTALRERRYRDFTWNRQENKYSGKVRNRREETSRTAGQGGAPVCKRRI